MKERDQLYRLAAQSLSGALNALLNPPADGTGLTIALLQTGIALHRLVELDWDERSKADVLAVLDRYQQRDQARESPGS